ncbi:MAG: hypothetical protein AB7F65_00720 [Dehalococcoidia bacterium]
MKQVRTVVVALLLVVLLSGSTVGVAQAGKAKDPCAKKNPPPECQVPEVPWTLLLPLGGVAIAGAYYLVDRRRRGEDSSTTP